MNPSLSGKVALVAGATRGVAPATVYVTGRTTCAQPSAYARPETIEETAALVTAAGGQGIAIQVDHLMPDDAWRYIREVREAGKPADATGYR